MCGYMDIFYHMLEINITCAYFESSIGEKSGHSCQNRLGLG